MFRSLLADHRSRGFTLVELMIAAALVAILVAIAVPAYHKRVTRSRDAQAVADMNIITMSIERYMSLQRKLPTSLADTESPALTDPWGRPYVYYNIVENGRGHARKDHALNPINTDYDLYSVGPDGLTKPQVTQRDSLDDVIRANNGTFMGVAADF